MTDNNNGNMTSDIVTVRLADREYSIVPPSIRKARELRARLRAKIDDFSSLINDASGIEITDVEGVGGLVDLARSLLIDSVDEIFDFLVEYSPDIAKDQEYLLDNATDPEAVDAFTALLGQLFPFGRVGTLINGLMESTTSASLHSQSTESTAKSTKST